MRIILAKLRVPDCTFNKTNLSEFYRLSENCNYTLAFAEKKTDGNLMVTQVSGHIDNYSPIWATFLFLGGLQAAYSTGVYFWRKRKRAENLRISTR